MNIESIGKKCYGCTSCLHSCPVGAISWQENLEGFFYPSVNSACIDCGKCVKVCPAIKDNADHFIKNEDKRYFGFRTKEAFAENSASGGFATYLSRKVIEQGGYVCGCALVNNVAKHIIVSRIEDLNPLQSSKYVQSDLDDCYSQIKNLLSEESLVLFIGTPCQVAGLKLFLGKEYEKLYTIDLICHGVPSPKLFAQYIDYLKKKEKSEITEYNFRCKKYGWGVYYNSYYCPSTGKRRINSLICDKYGYDFFKMINFRESCYSCGFADINMRPGDFTVGDFWGVNSSYKNKLNSKGVSSVIANTRKGVCFLENDESGNFFAVERKDILEGQMNLRAPSKRPKERDTYYTNITSDYFLLKKLPFKVRLKGKVPIKLKIMLKALKK